MVQNHIMLMFPLMCNSLIVKTPDSGMDVLRDNKRKRHSISLEATGNYHQDNLEKKKSELSTIKQSGYHLLI